MGVVWFLTYLQIKVMPSAFYIVAIVLLVILWVYRTPIGNAASFLVSSLNAFAKEYNDAYADTDETCDSREREPNKED